MKLTKKHYFLKPDQSDNHNIDNQNLNWDRVDRILTGMKMRMAIQTITQLLVISVLGVSTGLFRSQRAIRGIRPVRYVVNALKGNRKAFG